MHLLSWIRKEFDSHSVLLFFFLLHYLFIDLSCHLQHLEVPYLHQERGQKCWEILVLFDIFLASSLQVRTEKVGVVICFCLYTCLCVTI
uniref:Uncharacterized protein n=1 Tax=Salix viminalis TaxID=40686 RepID=A0A6N2NG28_SALVM